MFYCMFYFTCDRSYSDERDCIMYHLLGDFTVATWTVGRSLAGVFSFWIWRRRYRGCLVSAASTLAGATLRQLLVLRLLNLLHVVVVSLLDGDRTGSGDDGALPARRVGNVAFSALGRVAHARVDVSGWFAHGADMLAARHCGAALFSATLDCIHAQHHSAKLTLRSGRVQLFLQYFDAVGWVF